MADATAESVLALQTAFAALRKRLDDPDARGPEHSEAVGLAKAMLNDVAKSIPKMYGGDVSSPKRPEPTSTGITGAHRAQGGSGTRGRRAPEFLIRDPAG